MLRGNALLIESIQPVEFVISLANAEGRAAVEAVHEMSAFLAKEQECVP